MNAFTLKQLAMRWQCSVPQLRLMIKRGDLKAFRIGTDYRVTAEEVARIENQ